MTADSPSNETKHADLRWNGSLARISASHLGGRSILIKLVASVTRKYETSSGARLTFAQEVLKVPARLVLRVLQYRRTRRPEHLSTQECRYDDRPLQTTRKSQVIAGRTARESWIEMSSSGSLTSSFSPGESPFSTRNLLPLSAPSCSICGNCK